MTDELVEWVRQRREEGYTYPEIRAWLEEDGYNDATIDVVFDEARTGPPRLAQRLWPVQQYSWLVLYFAALGVYLWM
ncbi:MAG: hypothetical protein ABEI97_00740, partial [Candidatus Nanohaloarchaea archaeon]